ncbi:MAG: hypothetical protein AVDCRST_MAG80-407, partial [uncultured Rubrobacteraceae bacterium]
DAQAKTCEPLRRRRRNARLFDGRRPARGPL